MSKPAVSAKPAQKAASVEGGGGMNFANLAIPIAIAVAFLLYFFVLGNASNFEGGNPDGHPKAGSILGKMYKGGIIVAMLMGCFLIVLTFVIERFMTINRAAGTSSMQVFLRKVKSLLDGGNVGEALKACDVQKGSVANVVRAGLTKYSEMSTETGLDKDQKVAAIQKEIEDATSLELPMLEKNLVILATIASVATLIGLLGTVVGMIKAFSALATAGAPDAVALSNGISEALWNTALGIGTSAVAIIMYNYFTTKIDKLTYGIDEAGFSIAQTFAAKNK
jgi:biopolymer transport protein ExbB